MDGKHTPGPWAVGDYSPKRISYPILTDSGPMKGLQQPAEAGGRNESEALANANLIAAAPDLLAACKLALRDIEATLYLWPAEVSESPELIGARTRREVYAAAIRKAEGGEA